MSTSKFHITLEYSADNVKDESSKINALKSGKDTLTAILNKYNIPYDIRLLSDFYEAESNEAEPILAEVTQKSKDGELYYLYDQYCHGLFYTISSSYHILEFLVSLGVIPDSK